MEQLKYWLGFNLVFGIGPARVRRLLDHFGNLATAWAASPGALMAAGLDRRSVETLVGVRARLDLDEVAARLAHSGAQALTWDSPDYPANLRQIAAPPPVLFVRGTLAPADEWAVALVGTRRASGYGREVARELAAGLAAHGVTVISGLARGIDAVAHRATVEGGGRTLAVLGSGVDVIYPPEHRDLAAQIANAGAVVSDYPLGTPPDAVNFPPRNRLISGLAKAVVVIEADVTSGALITCTFAAEQGRDVFAVPGNINTRTSRGPNRLIQQGAKPVLAVGDILEELQLAFAHTQQTVRAAVPAQAAEARVLAGLAAGPAHIDELGAQLALPMAELSGLLAMMELKGLVRQVGAMQFAATAPAGPRD